MSASATDGSSPLYPALRRGILEAEEALPAPAAIVESLTMQIPLLPDRKLRDIWYALHGTRKQHPVDFRISVWLPLFDRIYLNVSAGKEHRNADRLKEEGLSDTPRIATLYAAIGIALLGYCLFGVFCFLYLLKSVLKLNVFSGESPLHPLYALFLA